MTRVYRFLSVALGVAALSLPAPATAVASESACPPPGGMQLAPVEPAEGDFSITGRGFGHGVGMSQYGAQGAAKLGCTAREILASYYPGTTLVTEPIRDPIRVGLSDGVASVAVTALSGPLRWETCGEQGCRTVASEQPAQATWTVTLDSNGAYVVHDGAQEVFRGGDPFTRLRARLDGTVARVGTTGHRYRWGVLELRGGAGEDGEQMTVVLEIASFEQYLYGLAEMPSAWEPAALQVQAVAGRTYALARHRAYNGNRPGCRCDVRSTVSDQAYTGYEKESEGTGAVWGKRWMAAVDATAGQTLRHEGRPIEAFYNSSHGGYGESSAFVFGGPVLPYLLPIDDTRWDSASGNPNLGWRIGVGAEELGAAVGVGVARKVRLPDPKGYGGRVGDPERGAGGVIVDGSGGSVTLSGTAFRRALRLRSALFDVQPSRRPEVVRVSGHDRIATAVAVSARGWQTSQHALLATAATFPDALAAGPLAGRLDAPLLLTDPLRLPDAVRDELTRLRVREVTILGGHGAVALTVEAQLRAAGFSTRRLHGDSRYGTAAAIAQEAGASAGGEVTVVLGEDWPDAVAAGAFTALDDSAPMLLAARDGVPEVTRAALRRLGARAAVLVGGTAALGARVEQQLRAEGLSVSRLSGKTRWATSSQVAHHVLQRLGEGATPDQGRPVVFASGQNFPDALAAGAFGARLDALLLLVPREDLAGAPAVRDFVLDHGGRFGDGFVLGGQAAVSEQVRRQLADALT